MGKAISWWPNSLMSAEGCWRLRRCAAPNHANFVARGYLFYVIISNTTIKNRIYWPCWRKSGRLQILLVTFDSTRAASLQFSFQGKATFWSEVGNCSTKGQTQLHLVMSALLWFYFHLWLTIKIFTRGSPLLHFNISPFAGRRSCAPPDIRR